MFFKSEIIANNEFFDRGRNSKNEIITNNEFFDRGQNSKNEISQWQVLFVS